MTACPSLSFFLPLSAFSFSCVTELDIKITRDYPMLSFCRRVLEAPPGGVAVGGRRHNARVLRAGAGRVCEY